MGPSLLLQVHQHVLLQLMLSATGKSLSISFGRQDTLCGLSVFQAVCNKMALHCKISVRSMYAQRQPQHANTL